jgi:hypothetical protein
VALAFEGFFLIELVVAEFVVFSVDMGESWGGIVEDTTLY